MRKRILSVVLAVLTAVTFVPQSVVFSYAAAAFKGECGNNVTFAVENNVLTIEGNGDMSDYTDDTPAPWRNCDFEKVVIKSGVRSVGEYAFASARKLREANLPETIITIGRGAFRDCSSLKNINIPEEVNAFNEDTFNGCSSLEKIIFPKTFYSIEERAFYNCSSLKDVELPTWLGKLSSKAFGKCTSLTEINIPKKVRYVAGDCFANCTSLMNFTVDEENETYSSVSGILVNKDEAILKAYPAGRTEFRLPDSVYWIGELSCAGCEKLKEVTIPDIVSCISEKAFIDCPYLKDVTVSENVEKIEDHAFGFISTGCTGNEDGEYKKVDDFILSAVKGSVAYSYAENCGLEIREINKTCRHENSVEVKKQAPTCTENGFTEGVYCRDCNTWISGHVVIPATGHTWDAGRVTKEPTCTDEGIMTFTCTSCGKTETGPIPATGKHTWDAGIVAREPTCTEEGIMIYTCTVCGEIRIENIPKTGIPGDVDGSGDITASDARIVLRASVDLETLTAEMEKIADVDRNGKVNASDARLILRRSVVLK